MSTPNIKVHQFKYWNEFKTLLWEHLPHENEVSGVSHRYLFRGSQDADWSLSTSFQRLFRWKKPGPDPKGLEKCNLLLSLFRDNCSTEDLAQKLGNNLLEWLAFARHHGLPTPTLDWSESPYIAALFAYREALCSQPKDAIDTLKSSSKMVAIWALERPSRCWLTYTGDVSRVRGKKRQWLEKADTETIMQRFPGDRILLFNTSKFTNERLSRQRGWMTYQVEEQDPLDEYIAQIEESETSLWKFELPLREAPTAMSDLHDMRINSMEIMPDFDGRAKHALERVILQYSF